jgi:hypothetical protein
MGWAGNLWMAGFSAIEFAVKVRGRPYIKLSVEVFTSPVFLFTSVRFSAEDNINRWRGNMLSKWQYGSSLRTKRIGPLREAGEKAGWSFEHYRLK